jgi:UDP-N-acetylglucosamine 2-epimerase
VKIFHNEIGSEEILIHTGQHYDPDYHLNVGSGLHGKQIGKILSKVNELLVKI